jgi:predicted nuclease with TOPRIM domain
MDGDVIAKIEEELQFDGENLRWEFERHATTVFSYGLKLNQIRAEFRKLETMYKRMEAQKVLDLRKILEATGEKWTVDRIKAKVLVDMVPVEEKVELKKQEVEFWTKVFDSFSIKGGMIQSYGALKRSELSFLD